jgi:large subunit ribosomal protein L17
MRNRIQGKQLSRDSDHRRAMLRNLAAGLFEHGSIETTGPKARAVQPFVERIITIARRGGLTARRQIEARLNDRFIHMWVADSNVPDSRKHNDYFDLPDADQIEFNRYGEVRKAPRLVQHIMTVVADRFRDRDGGYTRVVKTGRNRLGDGTDIVVLQFVGEEDGPQIGGGMSTRRRAADRRTAFAASLRKDAVVEAPVEEDAVEEAPLEEAAVEAAPETPAEAPAAEEAPAEEAVAEEAPAEEPAAEEDKPKDTEG